jgi:hypothetical protein
MSTKIAFGILSFENIQLDVTICVVRVDKIREADYDVYEYQLDIY